MNNQTPASTLVEPHQAPASQDGEATRRINRGIVSANHTGREIDAATARLIAAAFHPGDGSHLAEFAASGSLLPRAALAELERVAIVAEGQMPWYSALWSFLEDIDAVAFAPLDADNADPAPEPYVYVQTPVATDTEPALSAGRWVAAGPPLDELKATLDDLTANDARPEVTASIGFAGVTVDAHISAEELSRLAQGIHAHGEAYAALTSYLGFPPSDAAFTRRYDSSVDHAKDVFVAKDPDGLTSHDAILSEWLVLTGQTRVHVFTRAFGLPERDEEAL